MCEVFNMEKIAKFEKISYEQFLKDNNNDNNDYDYYDKIILPKRATTGSAGYDFFLPYELKINPKECATIKTGIRVKINEGWLLQIFPRSSLGFKYKMALANTVGIIDSDYYNALNEGHIMIKIYNNSDEILVIEEGKAFVQGIFVPYGITIDDDASENRTGGFGSSDKK